MTTAIHPRRPRVRVTPCNDSFMMDFENDLLRQWDNRTKEYPKGRKRFMDREWAKLVTSQVYPFHSDVDWDDYVDWVANGGGDDWFADTDEQCKACSRHENFCICVKAVRCIRCGGCVGNCRCVHRRETLWAYVNE
jgi:hypothetical protein